ncbi:MAG: hypothetical protein OEY14_01300 [Myxococcales bacterium]|nr:hypothetical protein [Myxococcales bacterium]
MTRVKTLALLGSLALLSAVALAQEEAPGAAESETQAPLRTQQELLREMPVPPHNDPGLREAPPRPGLGLATERAARLFEAIVHDDPSRAMDFLFPRDAFVILKGVSDPQRIYDRIHRMYLDDIHALHEELPGLERAEFDRLELSRRRGWVLPRQESNRLPYWAQRHSWLYYRVDGEERRVEVRTMIAWDDQWYITHLREFRH